MKLVACLAVSVASLCLVTGCATSQLHAQVDALSAENAKQAAEVRDLEARAAALSAQHVAGDLTDDGLDLAKNAWAWASDVVGASYHATESKASQCYKNIDFKSLKTAEDYKNAALSCWNTPSN
jgi:hypothetical protein